VNWRWATHVMSAHSTNSSAWRRFVSNRSLCAVVVPLPNCSRSICLCAVLISPMNCLGWRISSVCMLELCVWKEKQIQRDPWVRHVKSSICRMFLLTQPASPRLGRFALKNLKFLAIDHTANR
jgi:hypothetical protein